MKYLRCLVFSLPATIVALILFPCSSYGQYAGDALYLDSADSYAVLDDLSDLVRSKGTAFTIETWVYPQTSAFVIASVYENSGTLWSLRVGSYGSNSYRLILDTNDGYSSSSPGSIGSSASLTSGAWNHVAVTSDGSTVTFYVNGVEAGSFSDGRSIWGFGSSATLYIGTEYVTGTSALLSYTGDIAAFDNLRFWSTTRSLDELYNGMIYTPSTTTDLEADITFDDSSVFTAMNDALTDDSEVPWIEMPSGFPNGTRLAWELSTSISPSVLTISSDDLTTSSDSEGEYLIGAYDSGDLTTTTSTSATDLTAQLNRTWSVVPIGPDWCSFQFDMNSISGIEVDKAVAVVSTEDDFSSDVELIFPSSTENSYLTFNYYFTEYDTLFITLGEFETTLPTLTASLGFGPFIQSDANTNTFTLENLPSGTSSVTFTLYDQYGETTTDSETTSGSDLSEATYSYDMGKLAVGTILEVEIEASSLDASLTLVEPLAISEETPSITAGDDFGAYISGTSRVNTYTVDSLPDNTTSVTFAFVDVNGDIVDLIDTSGNIVYDSSVVSGTDLSTASWTVEMDTLDLPLGAQLSVTVEHEGGVTGGTEYLVDLEIYAAPITIYSTNGFGPFTSNNYSRVTNTTSPWSDVTDETNEFSISPLPERTEMVIFNILDEDGDILESDTVSSNGTEWLSSAQSGSFTMTDLPPDASTVQAITYAQGGADDGLIAENDLSIAQQAPRIFLDPSDYDDTPSNPYIPSEEKTTEVTITVEPSTTANDSVVVEIIDESGALLAYMSGTPTTVDGVPQVSFTYDFASLSFTVDSIVAYSYSSVSDDAVSGGKELTLIPPAPNVESWSGLESWAGYYNPWEFFTVSGIMDEIDEVKVEIYNTSSDEAIYTGTFTETTYPYSHGLTFDGSSTWFEAPREDGTFTVMLWYKSSATTVQPLVGVIDGSKYYPLLYLDSEGRINYTLYGSHTSGSNSLRTIGTFNDGDWHHVAITYDDSTMNLYVDGGLLARETDAPASATIGEDGSFVIGRGGSSTSSSLPSDYFDGEITEASFWNTSPQYGVIFQRLYIEGLGEFIKQSDYFKSSLGLVSYFPLADGGGSTAYDWLNDDSVDVNGTASWKLNTGLSTVVMPWDIEQMWNYAGADVELRVTLYYDGGSASGVTYTTSLPMTWNSDRLWLFSEHGFGPFREGVSADVDFDINVPEGMVSGDEVIVALVDSSGSTITSTSFTVDDLNNANYYYMTMDMGEAEPGSEVRMTFIKSDGDTLVTNIFPLVVEEFVLPTISGSTGPFRQAIVSGTMVDSNTFTITSYDDDVSFKGTFYGPTWDQITTADVKQRDDTTWTISYDMAALSPPLTRLVVETYIGTETTPSDRDTLALTITATRPDWFDSDNTSISDITENDDGTISFTVTTTINDPSTDIINALDDSDVSSSHNVLDLILYSIELSLVGEVTLEAPDPDIVADVTYDPSTETLSLDSDPSLSGTVTFDNQTFDYSSALPEATLDDDGNLSIVHDWDWSREEEISFAGVTVLGSSFFQAVKTFATASSVLDDLTPVSPYFTIGPVGLLGAATRIYTGTEDDEWGLIGDLDLSYDGESTNASYVLSQFGMGVSVDIGVQALEGATSATFDLVFEARVAGGTSFKSVPDDETKKLTSSGVRLYGKVVGKFLWGLWSETFWGPKNYYVKDTGDEVPESWPTPRSGWIWGSTGTERGDGKGSDNAVAGMPADGGATASTSHALVWPQPNGSTGENRFAAVWMEQDNSTGIGTLKLGTLGTEGGNLSAALTVVSNGNGISNPQVAGLNDSIHIVTWTQSRYSGATVPEDAGIRDIAQSLDIWYAVVNTNSRVVEQIGLFQDDLTDRTSGRLEGNAVVTPLSDSSALVTWIVSVRQAEESEIYSATIEREGDLWLPSTPATATTISGIEHSLHVDRVDDGKAVAVWITRPGTDVGGSRVMSMLYENGAWLPPVEVLEAEEGSHYNDLDIAMENGRGLLGVIGGTESEGMGTQIVTTIPWGGSGWDVADAVEFTDSTGYLQRPSVGINEEGIGVVLYQTSYNRKSTTSPVSHVNAIVIDLKDQGSVRHHPGHPLLGDSTVSLWDLHGAMYGDLLVSLVHETANPYAAYEPVNGSILGLRPMNLVLRGVRITDDLDIEDVDESDLLSSVSLPAPPRPDAGFTINRIEPNPFGSRARISYELSAPGRVDAEVLDAEGRIVTRLLEGARQEGGAHTLDLSGENLPNGAYFIRLTVDGVSAVRTALKVE